MKRLASITVFMLMFLPACSSNQAYKREERIARCKESYKYWYDICTRSGANSAYQCEYVARRLSSC